MYSTPRNKMMRYNSFKNGNLVFYKLLLLIFVL